MLVDGSDASYQVSVHLAKWFQRRRLQCEKLTDDRRRTPIDDKSSHCLWQGELKRTKGQTTIYKHTHKDKDRVTRTPQNRGCFLMR